MTILKNFKKRKYTSISLPWELVNEVQDIIDSGLTNYPSKASFITNAVRKRLDEFKK